jgi:proline iminopeptidase
VLFDQRNCGRSTSHASDPDIDLASNTTHGLIVDIELLRESLGIERWLVLGGSWGSVLALAYAERYPERVTEMVLFGVAIGRRAEFDWLFRGGVAAFFPAQWERLRGALPNGERDGDIVEGYHRLLTDPDPAVRERAAFEWGMRESATPSWPPVEGLAARFRDPKIRARIRPARNALRPARRVARGREPSARRGASGWHTGNSHQRSLRLSVADRQRLGTQAGVAARGARDRGQRRPRRR